MPILENTDLYDQGDSIDFLRKLERAGLFDPAPDEDTATLAVSDVSPEDELDERRAEIVRMTPLERQHLRRKQEHFSRYSLVEQGRMLKLYDDLDHDPHEDEMRRVMMRYHEWLDTLALSARAELADLPLEPRMSKIKELKQQQAAQRRQELKEAPSEQDLQAILRWSEQFGWQRRQSLLESLSPARQKYIEQLDEAKQRRAMLWMVVHHWQLGMKSESPELQDKSIAELTALLSTGAQHRLAALEVPDEKQKMIGSWVQTAIRHRVEAGGIRQLVPPVDLKELQRFSRDELTAEQRDALLLLSRDQKHRLLLRLYFMPAERLAQLQPGQPGWPQPLVPDNPKSNPRPKALKRLKTQT